MYYSREEWKKACQFENFSNAEILEQVEERLEKALKSSDAANPPVVLFDLDSTLFEIGPRILSIVTHWLESEQSLEYPLVRDTFAKLDHQSLCYSVHETVESLGLSLNERAVAEGCANLYHFWKERFFSNHYIHHDQPYPGAREFAERVHQLGATVVYLTGRDQPSMGHGTVQSLRKHSFPFETERTHLILKEFREKDDTQHKVEAAEKVRKMGTLVASFENEPRNVIAIQEKIPEGMHVFVDTVCSSAEARASQSLYRLTGWV